MRGKKNRPVGFFVLAILLLLPPRQANAQENTVAEADRLSKQVAALYQQGRYTDAVPLAQQAVEIRKRVLGEDHPDYAASLNVLAELYASQGRYAEAEPLYKRSLAIREKALGPNHLDVAKTLNGLVRLYALQDRDAESERSCKRMLTVCEKALGPDHPELATILNSLGVFYYGLRKDYLALPLYQRALAIREKALGPDHPDVAVVLNNLAWIFEERMFGIESEEAASLFKRALSIREKALGPDHPDVATSLYNLARHDYKRGMNAEAEPLYRRALAIRERALGPDHPDVAACLKDLAFLSDMQGRSAEAEALFKRVLAIWETRRGPDSPEALDILNRLARLYYANGRYAEAEPLYQRALAVREKRLGPDDPEVATTLNNLAELYRTQGRYAEAEPLSKRSLSIFEKALGSDHPNVAIGLNNLALIYEEQGRHAEAEPLYMRSLAINEKALGPGHPQVAANLNNLARLYEEQGQYEEAEPLFKRALAIREKALGPDHPDVATSLNNLGELYYVQGRYGEAEPLYKRSLAINEKTLGPDHPNLATSLNNLALLYEEQGKYGEAEPLSKRSLALFEKALGPDHPDLAQSLNNLALLYFDQSRYAEAETLYLRSLAIRERALGPGHPDLAQSLSNLASLYHAQGQFAKAAPFYERELQVFSGRLEYGLTFMSEKERLRFLNSVAWCFPTFFSFCLSYRDKLPELAGKMYDVVLWEKGFVARSIAALRAKIQATGDPEALRLFRRLAAGKEQIAKLLLAPAESEPGKQAAVRARIEQLEKEASDLEKQLVARSAALGEEKRLERVNWRQVRDALKPGEAAVEIVRFWFYDGKKSTGASYYVALVLRRESLMPEFVVLGEQKDLEKIPLTDYRRLVAESETDSKRSTGLGRRFYSAFWQPLEAKLGDSERVFVSPDGELNQVSLGIVPRTDGRLLMEACDLRTVNSTRDVLRGEATPRSGTAVMFGNPKFDLSEAEQRAALGPAQPARTEAAGVQTVQAGETQGVAGQLSRDLRGGALEELQGTQQEVEDVSAVLERKAWKVQVFTGAAALEERVKNVRQPRVLHLATHGFFEADQPLLLGQMPQWTGKKLAAAPEDPMLRSGLYLAGANRALKGVTPAPDMDDGILTAYEASQLDLQGTELVVLSACETGLGKTEAGEGIFGLRRALQVAGAEAVLMSLWSVPDVETRELMALFYKKWLGGKEKHQALREAQLEMREKVKARYGEDLPLYWGAFVLVGR